MATGEELKGESEAGKGGREGGRRGGSAMEPDDALSHNRIVLLPPLTLEVPINKQWQPERKQRVAVRWGGTAREGR